MDKHNEIYNSHHYNHYPHAHYHKAPMISWGAVIAGIVTTIVVSMLLSLLFLGLGFSNFSAFTGGAFGIGSMIVMLVGLLSGSYVAGLLGGRCGAIHGFLNWASLSLLGLLLSALAIGSALQMAGSVLSSGVNLAQNQQVETKTTVEGTTDSLLKSYGLSEDYLDKYSQDAKSKLAGNNYADRYIEMDRHALANAREAIVDAVSKYKNQSANAADIAEELKSKLNAIAASISSPIEPKDIAITLRNNNISNADIEAEAVSKPINIARVETRNKIMDIHQAIIDSNGDLNVLADNFAAKASHAVGHGVLWAFFSSLISAILSAIAGKIGSKNRHNKLDCCNHNYGSSVRSHMNDFDSDVKIRHREWQDISDRKL